VGVIIVAIVGNAAEHSTAVLFAWRGDMDVALGIAWESSKQIALFVAPVLVLAGILMGAPMDLAFTRFEVLSIGLAVIALALIALLAALRRGDLRALTGPLLRDGVFVGLLLGVGFLLQTEGLQRTSASRSGFLTGTLVVLTPLLEFALFRRRPPAPALLGVLL